MSKVRIVGRTRRGPHDIVLELEDSVASTLTVGVLRESVEELLRLLDERSARIMECRYGLKGDTPMTLHAIGTKEGVTRERIRQIEQNAFRVLSQNQEVMKRAVDIQGAIRLILELLGGVAHENTLADVIELSDAQDRAALRLILATLSDVQHVRETTQHQTHVRVRGNNQADVIHDHAIALLREAGQLLEDEIFLREMHNRLENRTSDSAVRSALSISRHVVRTPFKQWGLRGWTEATPRGVGDKAYIILKRFGKPLHFTKIAEHVNNAQFDQRKAHPQTVHNELIRDKRFVLVGRGLYALSEWGYVPGTVADVLERILKEAGKPLSKEELVQRVLKERMVKRNTVLLALQHHDRFQRHADGRYALTEESRGTD